MEHIIRDLLDVTAIEAGRLAVDVAPVPLGAVLDRVRELHAPLAAERGVAFDVGGDDPDAPPHGRRRPRAAGPREPRRQRPQVHAARRVRDRARRGRRTAAGGRLEVADTGPGIAPDHLPHLFDRFWQARETRRAGAGLGLAIVKGIAEAHDGHRHRAERRRRGGALPPRAAACLSARAPRGGRHAGRRRRPHVALLRGINVGRAKRVAMADLRALVEGLGYADVRTLLASGNVVFGAPHDAGPRPPRRSSRALAARLGVRSRVTVLDAAALAAIVAENPMTDAANAQPSRFLVAVLADADAAARRAVPLAALRAGDWGRERLAVGSRAVYLSCPDGISAGRLAEAVMHALGDDATTRNWATMMKLHALAGCDGARIASPHDRPRRARPRPRHRRNEGRARPRRRRGARARPRAHRHRAGARRGGGARRRRRGGARALRRAARRGCTAWASPSPARWAPTACCTARPTSAGRTCRCATSPRGRSVGRVRRRSTTCAPPRSPSGAWAPRAATPTRSPSSSARAWAAAWSRAGGCSAARAAPPGSSGTAPWSRPAPADAPAAAATPAASRRTPAAGRSPSGRARAARAAGGDAARALLALSGGAVDAIAAPHVTAAAAAGDALATHVVTETLDAVADAVVGLVNAFDPACVLFGGSVAEALPGLVPHVTAAVRTRALLPAAQEVRIARAALGNDAPVVGAALAALGPPGAR
jgi:uncharacterized protein (DUF1697 family)